MALIEKFHVVAAERDVAIGESIKEGQLCALNAGGEVVIQGASNAVAYGIAGDTKSTSASAMPGISAGWQNRVSDYFDETKASGKMTVYHSGGEFATDQFSANVGSADAGVTLYAANGVLDTFDQVGNTTASSPPAIAVGRLTQTAGAYPSGVPGIDINGDQALSGENSDTYIEFKLLI